MTYPLPFLFSLLLGHLTLACILRKEKIISRGLHFFLAAGLGLGLSAHITFYSYVVLGKLNKSFIVTGHIILFLFLVFIHFPSLILAFRKISLPRFSARDSQALVITLLATALFIPIWIQASYYPYGGWDAWSCWNLKAKFLFSGGENWQNMFSPLLWRSSPHYPLLQPLINVWGCFLLKDFAPKVPLISALLFTFLTAGLLFCGLRMFTNRLLSSLAALFILTLPFFVTIAISQYSDIVVAYFLLGGLASLLLAYRQNNKAFCIVAGLFLGFLGFAKSEGLVAVILIALAAFPYFWTRDKARNKNARQLLVYFLASLLVASLPTILFQFLYPSTNHTFINGLVSTTHPADLQRLKMITGFFFIELASMKWHGVWAFAFLAFALTGHQVFAEELKIFSLFLFSYIGAVLFYYFLNTYFDVTWWLSVSLNRILFSLLPITLFWMFYAVGKEKETEK